MTSIGERSLATRNYLVCYDIADKKRLAKVRKVAYSYALGGQKSAVEAPLDVKVSPLSFQEYLLFHAVRVEKPYDLISQQIEIERHFEHYMIYGGFLTGRYKSSM